MHYLITNGTRIKHNTDSEPGASCIECREANYQLALADFAETISYWPSDPLARILVTKINDALNIKYIN